MKSNLQYEKTLKSRGSQLGVWVLSFCFRVPFVSQYRCVYWLQKSEEDGENVIYFEWLNSKQYKELSLTRHTFIRVTNSSTIFRNDIFFNILFQNLFFIEFCTSLYNSNLKKYQKFVSHVMPWSHVMPLSKT